MTRHYVLYEVLTCKRTNRGEGRFIRSFLKTGHLAFWESFDHIDLKGAPFIRFASVSCLMLVIVGEKMTVTSNMDFLNPSGPGKKTVEHKKTWKDECDATKPTAT